MKKNIATEKEIYGHPVGLFMLFFTEMWERFSYYGMKALLVLYLTAEVVGKNPGLGWTEKEASGLYGWYTMLVYITPIIGGLIADRYFGSRKTILAGAILMTLGHLSLAFEAMPTFYLGLTLLILGNGAFKPNISSLVGQLYSDENESRKDAGYTIFYQGINVGAFLGTLLCGYFGETYGWHYGFGLAGIFMLIGYLQFKLSQDMFGDLGKAPKDLALENSKKEAKKTKEPLTKTEKDRLIVVGVLAFFSIFFWAAFEQAGASMNIFARDYTDRSLSGSGITIFKIVSAVISASPLLILTVMFFSMYKSVGNIYQNSMKFMALTVVILWGMIGFMIYDQFTSKEIEVPATWFLTLNALFIFTLAPLFSKIWVGLSKTKLNPNGPQKFALGLILLGIGFIPLVVGASYIDIDSTYKASMIFLTLAYLIHTLGELCLSPVGLSYVNKLSPKRYLGVLFGIWFFASAIGNKAAGELSGYMKEIQANSSLSDFFNLLVYIPVIAGIILFALSFPLKKLMHGIK